MKQSVNLMDDIPKAYLDGFIEFYKLRFKVSPDVLIPRPETELLVDEVLNFVASHSQLDTRSNKKRETSSEKRAIIIDLGTGSGAIAISLAKNLSHLGGLPAIAQLSHWQAGVTIIASDISKKALKIARQNAKLHGVEGRVTFIKSDLLNVIAIPMKNREKQSNLLNNSIEIASSSSTPRNDKSIDIIVANLPYIPSERIAYLDSSVKDFEPHVALDGGKDGFELYRKLFKQIIKRKLKFKLFVGEIDYTHGELALNEAQKNFPKANCEVKLDFAHKQRILIIKN